MELWRIVAVIVASSVVASITDWLFMGMLFHDKYLAYPEVWREGRESPRKILQSEAIGIIACLGFTVLLAHLPARPSVYIAAAGLTWIAGPVPMIGQNLVWMKLHPLVGVSHALGWLARFLITAVIAIFLLH